MKLLNVFYVLAVAAKKEQIILEDDYQYDPINRMDAEYRVYDVDAEIGILGILHDDGANRGSKHKTCGGVAIPRITCAGCSSGFPHYTRPCGEPEAGNSNKFKCRVKCGKGFRPTINRMKCVGGRWKKVPANGKIRCQRIKRKEGILEF